MRRLFLFSLFCLFALPSKAALEYLRFEGTIVDWNSGWPSYEADPSDYGYTVGQSIYFVFAIDTSLDASGYPDPLFPNSPYDDNFFVEFIAGSASPAGYTVGETSAFPEGINSWLHLKNPANLNYFSLKVGTIFDPEFYGDESIHTWSVDNQPNIYLTDGAYHYNRIGDLDLTYRGASLAAAIVPIPAATWLFISAIGVFSLARRKNNTA